MATRTSQFYLPNPTTGAQEIHHFETEAGQVVGLKEKFRQPSTAYTAGQIAYHSALPTGWYLECTTAGTSSSGDLTISSPTVGGTVTDGTVVWTVKCIQRNLQIKDASSISNIDLDDLTKEGVYHYTNYDVVNNPDSSYWGTLFTTNVISSNSNYIKMQLAESASGRLYTRTKTGTGSWSDWLKQEAIVAKSLGANGYIKYASGLIVQWGFVTTNSGSGTRTFPIAFNNSNITIAGSHNGTDTSTIVTFNNISTTQFKANTNKTGSGITFLWIAIGY